MKQHFSNRHSVPLISKRTLLSYFPLFPFRFTQLLHAPSFLLPFRCVSLPFDVPNYHPSTNFLLLFHSLSLFRSHDETRGKQTVKVFNSESNEKFSMVVLHQSITSCVLSFWKISGSAPVTVDRARISRGRSVGNRSSHSRDSSRRRENMESVDSFENKKGETSFRKKLKSNL